MLPSLRHLPVLTQSSNSHVANVADDLHEKLINAYNEEGVEIIQDDSLFSVEDASEPTQDEPTQDERLLDFMKTMQADLIQVWERAKDLIYKVSVRFAIEATLDMDTPLANVDVVRLVENHLQFLDGLSFVRSTTKNNLFSYSFLTNKRKRITMEPPTEAARVFLYMWSNKMKELLDKYKPNMPTKNGSIEYVSAYPGLDLAQLFDMVQFLDVMSTPAVNESAQPSLEQVGTQGWTLILQYMDCMNSVVYWQGRTYTIDTVIENMKALSKQWKKGYKWTLSNELRNIEGRKEPSSSSSSQ